MMTTVAYHHKDGEIAVDSRCTAGTLIASDSVNKITKKDGVSFIGTGALADLQVLIEGYPNGFAAPIDLEAQALVVDEGEVYMVSVIKGDYSLTKLDFDSTMGSGADFAQAAMDFGKSAKDAVKYAATRDCATGGRIRVIKTRS